MIISLIPCLSGGGRPRLFNSENHLNGNLFARSLSKQCHGSLLNTGLCALYNSEPIKTITKLIASQGQEQGKGIETTSFCSQI